MGTDMSTDWFVIARNPKDIPDIVRALNQYGKLVAERDRLRAACKRILPFLPEDIIVTTKPEHVLAANDVRAALAEVEGE